MFEYSIRYRIKRGIRWNDRILRMFNNYVTIRRPSQLVEIGFFSFSKLLKNVFLAILAYF